jgi:hypothetical protein
VAAYLVPGILAVVILCMSVMRDILRDAYLKPWFNSGQFAVKTQWSVLPLFLALFVAGVILWLVMLARYGLFRGWFGGRNGQSPSVDSQAAGQP